VLFAVEFLADKVPIVDSVWDAIHTVIRPVGGALLASHAPGDLSPVAEVLMFLLLGARRWRPTRRRRRPGLR
jgi:hypothetical protein